MSSQSERAEELFEARDAPFSSEKKKTPRGYVMSQRKVWESWRQVEQATASWVHWYNSERLHSSIEDQPPGEHEEIYYDLTRAVGDLAAA